MGIALAGTSSVRSILRFGDSSILRNMSSNSSRYASQHFIRVRVKLAGVLKSLVSTNQGELELLLPAGSTVRDLIHSLYFRSPELYGRIWNSSRGTTWPDILILVNDIDVRLLKGLDTELEEGVTVTFIAYIHGG